MYKNTLYIIIVGIIIAAVVILIWICYAYFYYRTSMDRLIKIATTKFMMIIPKLIINKYVIECVKELSAYDRENEILTAVFRITPDSNNPDAPLIPLMTRRYNIVYDSDSCDPNKFGIYIGCININESP